MMSAEIAEEALSMYMRHGGRRKLSYFDSMHLATAKRYGLGVRTLDLARWEAPRGRAET
jgi:predicted nucleic acid-binding protein